MTTTIIMVRLARRQCKTTRIIKASNAQERLCFTCGILTVQEMGVKELKKRTRFYINIRLYRQQA